MIGHGVPEPPQRRRELRDAQRDGPMSTLAGKPKIKRHPSRPDAR